MTRLIPWLLALACVLPITALAQLPPPTAEEAAQKAAATEKKAASEEAAKAALAQVQERVASRYRAAHPDAPPPVPVVTLPKLATPVEAKPTK